MKKVLLLTGALLIALIGAVGWLFVRMSEKRKGQYYYEG